MTLEDSVRFGNTTIDYHVRRSKRRKKTVQITVDGGDLPPKNWSSYKLVKWSW